jgi:hypothetical protein
MKLNSLYYTWLEEKMQPFHGCEYAGLEVQIVFVFKKRVASTLFK